MLQRKGFVSNSSSSSFLIGYTTQGEEEYQRIIREHFGVPEDHPLHGIGDQVLSIICYRWSHPEMDKDVPFHSFSSEERKEQLEKFKESYDTIRIITFSNCEFAYDILGQLYWNNPKRFELEHELIKIEELV